MPQDFVCVFRLTSDVPRSANACDYAVAIIITNNNSPSAVTHTHTHTRSVSVCVCLRESCMQKNYKHPFQTDIVKSRIVQFRKLFTFRIQFSKKIARNFMTAFFNRDISRSLHKVCTIKIKSSFVSSLFVRSFSQ
jgi:hypothetical protein